MYEKRVVSFLELWEVGHWRLKVYGIAYRKAKPDQDLVDAAKRIAELDALPRAVDNYGVGFIGVHQGFDSNFVFVDWWANENELHHHVYVSPLDDLADLNYETPTGLSACVWDLFVMGFEREAWVSQVLQAPDADDFEAYLLERFEGTV